MKVKVRHHRQRACRLRGELPCRRVVLEPGHIAYQYKHHTHHAIWLTPITDLLQWSGPPVTWGLR